MNQDVFVLIEHVRGGVAELSYVMLAAGRTLAQDTHGRVVAILLGHNAQHLANELVADQVWYMDHPALADFNSDIYLQALEALLTQYAPRLVLFGDSSIGAEVAGPLSSRLGLPLVSYCRGLHSQDDALKYTSQVCGGKIMFEGELPAPTALVMMMPGGYKPEAGHSARSPDITRLEAPTFVEPRLRLLRYIEPEISDVDIAKENYLVAVGRGIQNQDNLHLAQELADALGAVVCSSRPVVDQGWLPTSRLVGKSGKHVKPKLYLALGISGAPEHVEAISDTEMIVAVNTDPDAPIFNLAKYGSTLDLLNLVPALTEQLQQIGSAIAH